MSGLFDVPDGDLAYDGGEEAPVSTVQEEKKAVEFLNAEEDEVLRMVRSVRLKIVERLTDFDGKFAVPEKGTDKILLDQCLTALSDEQFKRAKGRKDVQVGESAADWADALARSLMSRQSRRKAAVATPEQRTLPASVKVTDIKPGEMDEGCKPLTMADITG